MLRGALRWCHPQRQRLSAIKRLMSGRGKDYKVLPSVTGCPSYTQLCAVMRKRINAEAHQRLPALTSLIYLPPIECRKQLTSLG